MEHVKIVDVVFKLVILTNFKCFAVCHADLHDTFGFLVVNIFWQFDHQSDVLNLSDYNQSCAYWAGEVAVV